MSVVILLGGNSAVGNPEHRYLANQFLEHFGDRVTRIVTAEPISRPMPERLKRMIRRGNYAERLARFRYKGGYGPAGEDLQRLLLPREKTPMMPGGSRCVHVDSHNSASCEAILDEDKPEVIVVYGTRIIRSNIFERAARITLNMHTGLSPFYRGDSTLFWPVYYKDPAHLGVTVHELVASIDGGDIATTVPVTYSQGDGEAELFAKGVKAGTAAYIECVDAALSGNLTCHPQDLSLGREYSWTHRTVAAERQVLKQFEEWAVSPP